MTALFIIAVRLAEGIVGLTARQRWQATQHLESSGSFMTSKWFTIAMVVVLVVSIVTLLIVSMLKKIRGLKTADRVFSENAAGKGLSESEADILMAIAVSAGLKNSEDIFNMNDAFERGAVKLLSASGAGTNETSRLEKQLAGLREKLRFPKVKSVSTSTAVVSSEKQTVVRPVNMPRSNGAFIAIFPFVKKVGDEWNQQLPEFLPATAAGVVGQVVYLETTLAANVGDRVLVVIGRAGADEGAKGRESIEDIGFVKQSIQPAEMIKEPNARRLAIELAGLNEAQIAQLAGVIGNVKTTGEAKTGDSASQGAVKTVQDSAGSKEQLK